MYIATINEHLYHVQGPQRKTLAPAKMNAYAAGGSLIIKDSDSLRSSRDKRPKDGIVKDAPFWIHWPKFILWWAQSSSVFKRSPMNLIQASVACAMLGIDEGEGSRSLYIDQPQF